MQENLQAIANVSIPFMLLLEKQMADTVTNTKGVPADVFVEVVFSDRANNDQKLPAISPRGRDEEDPGQHQHVDHEFALDTRFERMQALHFLAGVAFEGLIDKGRYFLDATMEIRRADSDVAIKYIVTLREDNGQRIPGENELADNEFDWTL